MGSIWLLICVSCAGRMVWREKGRAELSKKKKQWIETTYRQCNILACCQSAAAKEKSGQNPASASCHRLCLTNERACSVSGSPAGFANTVRPASYFSNINAYYSPKNARYERHPATIFQSHFEQTLFVHFENPLDKFPNAYMNGTRHIKIICFYFNFISAHFCVLCDDNVACVSVRLSSRRDAMHQRYISVRHAKYNATNHVNFSLLWSHKTTMKCEKCEWVSKREREGKREIRWKTDCLRNYCYFCFSLINTFIIIWRRCIFESPLDCNRWQWSTDMLLLLQHTILAERYEQVTNLSASHAPFTRLTGLSFTRKNPSTDRFWLVFAMKCSIRIYCRISC